MTPKELDIKIYTTEYCPYCHAAKEYLQSKKYVYQEIDVTHDDAMREKLVAMTGGKLTVPQIFINGNSVGGYTDIIKIL